MEHVPGRSLSEIIKQDGPLDPAEVADIGAQVADGLAAAHAAGTMHRDVKPGNVLDPRGRRRQDQRLRDRPDDRRPGPDPVRLPHRHAQLLLSRARPRRRAGPAADVWALGATLYAAVEGHVAVRGSGPTRWRCCTRSPRTSRRTPAAPSSWSRPCCGCSTATRAPAGRWRRRPPAAPAGRGALAGEDPREHTVSFGSVPAVAAAPPPQRAPCGRGAGPRAVVDGQRHARDAAPRRAPGPGRRRPGRRGVLLVLGGVAYARAARRRPGPTDTAGAGRRERLHRSVVDESPKSEQLRGVVPHASPSSPTRAAALASPSAASGTGLAAQPAFLERYFASAPGGTDEGWSLLTPATRRRSAGLLRRLLAHDRVGVRRAT